ncbi:hypothetical protein BDU57DRAFT_581358 [Ampelomyces quisqualis]|uniref:Uncharacterized protein n=1 Tax=Ampelomyces quisqualis TaxID=50730 RepID=A0A6A5QDL5_AMPQU|nr:hypothetical protein BDU57DRAFT_581358 [Ampelomyces quisqualis]
MSQNGHSTAQNARKNTTKSGPGVPEKIRKTNVPIFKTAPSRHLAFPQQGDITVAEIFAFLPNAVRSHDIAFRFATNGMNNHTAATIANYFRAPEDNKKATANNMCKLIQTPMRACGKYSYTVQTPVDGELKAVVKGWSVGLHQKFNTKSMWEVINGPWDSKKLSLADLNVDVGAHHKLINNVSFASLAVGVHRFPSIEQGDGLNLTRCVLYALTHTEEDFMFPRDFAMLTAHVGAARVQPQHYDEATFNRWRGRAEVPAPATIVRPSPYLAAVSVSRAAAAFIPALSALVTSAVATPFNPGAAAPPTPASISKLRKISKKTIMKPVTERCTAGRTAAQARQTNLVSMVDNGQLLLNGLSPADPAAQYSVSQSLGFAPAFRGEEYFQTIAQRQPSQLGFNPLQAAPLSPAQYDQNTAALVLNCVTDDPGFANEQLEKYGGWKTPTPEEFDTMITNIVTSPPTSWPGYNDFWSRFDSPHNGSTTHSSIPIGGYSAQARFGTDPAQTGDLVPMNNDQVEPEFNFDPDFDFGPEFSFCPYFSFDS